MTQLRSILRNISRIGVDTNDSNDLIIQKSLLVIISIPFIFAGLLWGVMYYLLGEFNSAVIPLSYSVVSLISLVYFAFSHRFEIFRFSQLIFILLLPFILMLSLGGYINGSAVIVWSLISPFGSLLFYKRDKAPYWLLAYLLLVWLSFFMQPYIKSGNNLSPWQVNLFFCINLIAVSSLLFTMVYYFVGRKAFYEAQSESLLLNILPEETASELKTKGSAEARYFDSVTVMFTDFKNFTQASEKLAPAELVQEIHYCYSEFDRIITQHKLEKIKTIGDSYMCAGGLPVPNKTHAADTVKAAREICDFMKTVRQIREAEGKPFFEIRIGCHTGPVVAGIVGIKKFAYDIWGDTVNVASRMESGSEAGKVNISGATYELVKDEFRCEYRGKIQAKNKGEIDMYFAESIL